MGLISLIFVSGNLLFHYHQLHPLDISRIAPDDIGVHELNGLTYLFDIL